MSVNWKRLVKTFCGMLLLCAVFGFGAYQLYVHHLLSKLDEQIAPRAARYQESLSAGNIEETTAALKEVSKELAFLNFERTADAGPYLNHQIPVKWSVAREQEDRLSSWQKAWPHVSDESILAISELPLDQPIDDTKLINITSKVEPGTVHYKDLDASWFDHIESFDYWNLEDNSPLAWKSDEEYAVMGWTINLIDFLQYVDATVLKQFIAHRDSGRLEDFERKSAKLASLLVSTEDMLMTVGAEIVMKNTRDYLRSADINNQASKYTLPIATIARNIKNLMPPSAALLPATDELLKTDHPLVCVGLHEWFRTSEIIRSYVGMEGTYKEKVDELFKLQAQNCRFQRVKAYRGQLKTRDIDETANFLPHGGIGLKFSFAVFDIEPDIERYFYALMTEPLQSIRMDESL